MTYQVGIYLYQNVEVLDFSGPYEVFTTASRLGQRTHPGDPPLFEVKLLAVEPGPVKARGGLQVLPEFLIAEAPELEILIIPGGIVDEELHREEMLAWVTELSHSIELIASVCTGSFILGAAGLLSGLRATTHWEDLEVFADMFPEIEVVRDLRWVEAGRLITSAGISAGIDLSLRIISRLEGRELALATARQMDYRWQETP